jgi:hypothetical protein
MEELVQERCTLDGEPDYAKRISHGILDIWLCSDRGSWLKLTVWED